MTEGLTAWIKLVSNSQSTFSLPSAGITDAYHHTSLISSLHGMKGIGFLIILAGAIQEKRTKQHYVAAPFLEQNVALQVLTVQGKSGTRRNRDGHLSFLLSEILHS